MLRKKLLWENRKFILNQVIILDGKGEGRIGVRLNVREEDLKAFLDKTGNEKDTIVTYKVVIK